MGGRLTIVWATATNQDAQEWPIEAADGSHLMVVVRSRSGEAARWRFGRPRCEVAVNSRA